MDLDLPAKRLKKIEEMQNLLILVAVDGDCGDVDAYQRLRLYLITESSIRNSVPAFIPKYRDLNQFWSFIESRFSTYEERQQFIWQEFRPVLDIAEKLQFTTSTVQTTSLPQDLKADHVHTIGPATTSESLGSSFPTIALTPETKLWLETAYSRFRNGKQVNPNEMIVELWEKISEDFDYQSIDGRLIQFYEITLLGILHVDPNTDLVDKTDRVVRFVRELIKSRPEIITITLQEIAEGVSISETEIWTILRLLSHLGSFWHNAVVKEGTYISVRIEIEEIRKQYMRYKGIADLMNNFYAQKEPPPQVQHVTPSAFAFIVDPRIARIVERDYAELRNLNPSQATKSVLVLSGGIIEALLIDALVSAGYWTFDDARKHYLNEMIHPSKEKGIIQHDNLTQVLRVFRNVIHSAREIQDDLSFSEEHATLARAAVDVIMKEVRDWHSKKLSTP